MENILTIEEYESKLGEDLKGLRLQRNWTQKELSKRAGINVNSLSNLENGSGSSLKTLIRVLQSLDRLEWLKGIAPKVSVNPLHVVKDSMQRQRASGSSRKRKNGKEKTKKA